jgi:hypothetical protein
MMPDALKGRAKPCNTIVKDKIGEVSPLINENYKFYHYYHI